MTEVLGSIWWLIVTLGVLVTFHEFGHFIVARRCGVKVLRFSVGFGQPLWKRVGRDGTEYWIAWIPLGGYVKMLDAREGEVPASERGREFTGKPIWQRIAIVAAGPAFNLVFALLAFWVMFMIGKPDYAPIIAPPQGIAAQAGFHAGDRLLKINGHEIATWSGALDELGADALLRQPVPVTVKGRDGEPRRLSLPLDQLPADLALDKAFDRIGLRLRSPPAVAATVAPGQPAAQAGMQPGDRIVSINGQPVANFQALGDIIEAQAAKSPQLTIAVVRDGEQLTLQVRAQERSVQGSPQRWMIGIGAQAPPEATLRYGPLEAIGASLRNTWDKTATTFEMIGRMITGQVSTRSLSGVITIAQVANTSATMGVGWFLGFLGLISLSLAILNILPIPLLDGGHLLYYLIEIVKGSPISERTMIAGQYIGMALLAALMGLAFYNDILRLVS
ncbi:MAG TPA: RIP metalloprotease RseP [Rhodanobacteraceae bacterium]|nr:RIP metalloprotease RseP [Rhodanobacteraceae bacterium]